MYIVTYDRIIVFEDGTFDKNTKAYFCKSRKNARKYVKRRFGRIVNTLIKKSSFNNINHIDSMYAGDDYYYVEYPSDVLEYPYIREEFNILRANEIVEGPNGFVLK